VKYAPHFLSNKIPSNFQGSAGFSGVQLLAENEIKFHTCPSRCSLPGLPDGTLVYQFWYTLEGLGNNNFVIFTAIWYFLHRFGTF
jgi:hypothetical protein